MADSPGLSIHSVTESESARRFSIPPDHVTRRVRSKSRDSKNDEEAENGRDGAPAQEPNLDVTV